MISLVAVLLFGYVPNMMAEQAWRAASLQTEQLEMSASADAVKAQRIRSILEQARLNHDLLYLVSMDEDEQVRNAINLYGAEQAGYHDLDEKLGGVVYRTRVPRFVDNQPAGYLYVGWSTASYRNALHRGRWVIGIFSISLCLLAIVLVVGAWRAKRSETCLADLQSTNGQLFSQKGQLEMELETRRAAEGKLRQSEQRYRVLFENAMSSAYADLEEQKEHLEQEVGVRRQTEEALRYSTRRLEAINEIRHGMLCLKPSADIAHLVLKHLSTLVPCSRAYVVEYDHLIGEGIILALIGADSGMLAEGTRLPLSVFEALGTLDVGPLHYEEEIEAQGSASAMRQALSAAGARSCIYAPLVVQDEVAGLLYVGAKHVAAYAPGHLENVQEVADLLAATIRQNRMAHDRERYETELIIEKERAQEMARLKSSFLTNMTHEIRTPLTSIIGFAQILKEEVGEEHEEFTGLIEESAGRLLDTINSVLDLAKLESNRMTFQPELLDIRPEVEQTARLLESMATKKGLALQIEHYSRDARAHLDRAGLSRVVNNLVGNAIKFTQTGTVTVTTENDDLSVYIRVRDSGIGISAEFVPRLFDEFRQESTGIDRDHEGSGLGLAITHKLVHLMNGEISVESEQGQGTTFTVRFPRIHTPNGDSECRSPDKEKRVLVLADKEDAIYLLEYILREHYAYEIVHTVPAALKLALTTSFDAVLVDVNLHDSAEISFLKQVRQIPRYRQTPIIAMATQILPADWQPYLETGFDAYVDEPFVQESMLGVLKEKMAISEVS